MHNNLLVEGGMPVNQAEKAMILLHGRGGSARDIISLAERFNVDNFYIVAPQATNNSWYPYSFLAPEEQNEPWLSSAVEVVKKLIDEIALIIGTENIYIMGFSQGACLALETASRYAVNYAGVIGFTGGLIGNSVNPAKYSGNFNATKVFIGNSDNDPHVPVERSEQTKVIMESLGANVRLNIYPCMAHTIIKDEIEMVSDWMNL